MTERKPQLFFVISNRVGDSTKLQGQSIASLQAAKTTDSLEIEYAPTAEAPEGYSTPLPSLNYKTSVDYVNVYGMNREAIITITHFTKKGPVKQRFTLNKLNKTAVYVDENYVIKFGIADFEVADEKSSDEEYNRTIKDAVAKIKTILGLKTASVIANNTTNDPDLNR